MAHAHAHKSTNVRSYWAGPLKTCLGLVQGASPAVASTIVEPLFLFPRRFTRPAREVGVLTSAEAWFVPFEGVRLPVWSWGSGPNVLLVHGWEGRGSQLGAFVEPLVRAGFRVTTFDGPAHGDAAGFLTSVVTHGRATAAVMRSLEEVHALIGHSVGGPSSLLASETAGPPSRYVMLAPPTSPERFTKNFSQMLGLTEETLHALFLRFERRFGISMPELDMLRAAPRARAPLLLVHDEDDKDVPLEDGLSIANAWPEAEVHTTRGLGHRRILWDEGVVSRVTAFVAKEATDPPSLEEELFRRDLRRAKMFG